MVLRRARSTPGGDVDLVTLRRGLGSVRRPRGVFDRRADVTMTRFELLPRESASWEGARGLWEVARNFRGGAGNREPVLYKVQSRRRVN